MLTPSPFRTRNHNIRQSPLRRSYYFPHNSTPFRRTSLGDFNQDDGRSIEPLPCDLLDASVQGEIDWEHDPFLDIRLKPSFEDSSHSDHTESHSRNLELRLDALRESICDIILRAPLPEQPALVNVFASWGRQLASDPLGDHGIKSLRTGGGNTVAQRRHSGTKDNTNEVGGENVASPTTAV